MSETKITDFGGKLTQAIEDNKNDINQLVWRTQSGSTVRLIDMNYEDLQRAYFHVLDMLYNKASYNNPPGKLLAKENVKRIASDCNAELFHRYLLYELNGDIFKTNQDIINFIMRMKHDNNISESDSVTAIFDGLNPVFNSVTVGKLMAACFDKLEIVNRKLISDKFILSQGIWLTKDEKDELLEYDDNGKPRSYLDVVKERLFIDNIKLKLDPKGLSYGEFRALITIQPFSKVSSLPTKTLELLRDKILLLLENNIDYHIDKWFEIKTNIEKVAQVKHFILKVKTY